MAKFITLKRKYALYGGLVLAVVFLSFIGVNLWQSSETSSVPEQVEPEIKILSVEFDPQIVIRDISYEGKVHKGVQTVPKTDYKVSAVVQNMTEKTMNDIPVILTISSLADKSKKLTKEGKISALEPGATAKIAFENIKALGDAAGKSATAGQHELVLAFKANAEGGMNQNTQAKILYNVDSSIK